LRIKEPALLKRSGDEDSGNSVFDFIGGEMSITHFALKQSVYPGYSYQVLICSKKKITVDMPSLG
jgi:hypothetical protein